MDIFLIHEKYAAGTQRETPYIEDTSSDTSSMNWVHVNVRKQNHEKDKHNNLIITLLQGSIVNTILANNNVILKKCIDYKKNDHK